MKNDMFASGSKSIGRAFGRAISAAWRTPKPLLPPEVDPNLPDLPSVQRVAEVFRYNLLQLEYALSSGGGLREYIKFNLRVALTLLIPSLLVGTAISIALAYIHSWSELILAIAVNALLALLAVCTIVGILSGALFAIRNVIGSRYR